MSRTVQVTFDAHDPRALASFWRDALGYVFPPPPGVELPEGADPLAAWDDFLERMGVPAEERNTRSALEDPDGHGPRLFFQRVPEDKVVKNRVHLDLRVPDVASLVQLGATVLAEHERWTVLVDPEGNELCAFADHEGEALAAGAPAKVFALCVDSDRPEELAAWWHARLGGTLVPASDGARRWIEGPRGLETMTWKCVRVADERVVKNRSHWDVVSVGTAPRPEAEQVAELVAAGAEVRRARDDEIRWTVLTDPDGNEFCLFTDGPAPEA